MLAVLLAMQATGGSVPPAQPAAADPAAPMAPAPPPPYAMPPPGAAPQPVPSPYGAPYYPYPYPAQPYPAQPYPYPPQPYPPPPPPPPREVEPERELVSWFVRIDVGLGPPGFSEETDLLKLEGYGGTKFWASLDGGYLFHPNIGVGAFMGLSHWSSSPDEQAPSLDETSFFLGGELPLRFGSRSISLVLAPRLGFCSGEVSLGGDVPSQSAVMFGGDLSVTSFKYHLTGSVGFLRAPVDPPGELARDHDFGGLYVVIGGVIDG